MRILDIRWSLSLTHHKDVTRPDDIANCRATAFKTETCRNMIHKADYVTCHSGPLQIKLFLLTRHMPQAAKHIDTSHSHIFGTWGQDPTHRKHYRNLWEPHSSEECMQKTNEKLMSHQAGNKIAKPSLSYTGFSTNFVLTSVGPNLRTQTTPKTTEHAKKHIQTNHLILFSYLGCMSRGRPCFLSWSGLSGGPSYLRGGPSKSRGDMGGPFGGPMGGPRIGPKGLRGLSRSLIPEWARVSTSLSCLFNMNTFKKAWLRLRYIK